jgi:hypothetical protein
MKFKERWFIVTWWLIIIAILLPFLILAWYNWPASDDYFDWMILQDHGVIHAVNYYYLNWGGRFTSYVLVFLLNPLHWGENSALCWLTFLQLGMFLSLCFGISRIWVNSSQNNTHRGLAFGLLTIFWWGYLPRPVELLYWFTGSMTYLPGLLGIYYWYHLNRAERPQGITQKSVWAFLPFFIAGTNELNIVLMSFVLCWCVYVSNEDRKKLIPPLIFFLIGAGFALLSPGNTGRSDFFETASGLPVHDIGFTFKQSSILAFHSISNLLFKTPVLLIGAVLGFIPSETEKKKRHIGLLVIASILVPLALYTPFCFGTGQTTPPDRVNNVVFLSESFLLLLLCQGILLNRFKMNKLIIAARTAGLFCLILPGNRIQAAWKDVGKVEDYQAQQTSRRVFIEESKVKYNPMMFTFTEIQSPPYTLFYGDLNSNSEDHFNQGFARYHNIKAVKIQSIEKP